MVWKKSKECNGVIKIQSMFRKVCMTAATVFAAGLLTGFGTDSPAGKTGADKPARKAQEADVIQYNFGPVSYDLTNLPPMKNKLYAAWEGRIYYRQYSDEDMEEGGLWGDFSPIADTEKELMCMERDGSVTQVGVDYGYDGMYIVEGRIYSQKWKPKGTSEVSVVYSCALDGSDVIEYASDRVLDVAGSRIICSWKYDGISGNDGISWIDAKDGREHVLVFKAYPERGVEYLGATEEELFYYQLVENEETESYDLHLYAMDYQGNEKELMTVTMQEYIDSFQGEEREYIENIAPSPLFIPFFQILGDDIYFSVGTTNGTAHIYSGGLIYGMRKDGSRCKLLSTSYYEYFYLYDDGQSRSLYCKPQGAECGIAAGKEGMRQIRLFGKTQKGIIPWEGFTAYDEPRVYLYKNPTDSIVFYPDTSGICYVLLTVEESEKLAIATTKDSRTVQQVDGIEYLEGKLFFTVTDLTYSTHYSLGWRDGYERGRSVCYCKDLINGKIRKLYAY